MLKQILAVDNDKKFLSFLKEILTHMGYADVLLAEDGQEALDIVREKKPELMVLDLAMPKMHGYEVCKAVRADSDPEISGIKIIIVSAKNYPIDMKTAKDVGANLYLVKPFSMQELRDAIASLLKHSA